MVRQSLGIIKREVPNQFSVPGELLDPSTGASTAREWSFALFKHAGTEQVPVLQKVGAQCGTAIAFPGPHYPSFHVDQMSRGRRDGGEQGVGGPGVGAVDRQAELWWGFGFAWRDVCRFIFLCRLSSIGITRVSLT